MSGSLNMTIKETHRAVGSKNYVLLLEITNVSDSSVGITDIIPTYVPGDVVSINGEEYAGVISELREEKKRLRHELQRHVDMGFVSKIGYLKTLPFLKLSFSGDIYKNRNIMPNWALESTRVIKPDCLTKFKTEFIDEIKNEAIVESFKTDKEKFEKVIERLEVIRGEPDEAKRIYTLNKGEVAQFPIVCKAPLQYRAKTHDIVIKVLYKGNRKNQKYIYDQTCNSTIKILPTGSSIPIGVILGGIIGSVVNGMIINEPKLDITNILQTSFSTVLLSLIVASYFYNNDEARKNINIENFSSSVLLGGLVGLFTNKFIEVLSAIITL